MEVVAADKPDWLAKLKLNEMKIDWQVLGENQDKWMTYWADNIKGLVSRVVSLLLVG